MASVPRALRTLQKNARDKEYRLRRAGASPEQVAAMSPRVSAEEVARMSGYEQVVYAKRLAHFNSRKERYTVTASGDLLPPVTSRGLSDMRKEYNRQARARERELNRAFVGSPLQQGLATGGVTYESVREALVAQGYGVTIGGRRIGGAYVGGQVAVIGKLEPPSSARAAQRRAAMFKEMISPGHQEERRARTRDNLRKMMEAAGLSELADAVDELSDTAFDLLTTVTPFMSELSTKYEVVAGSSRDRVTSIYRQAAEQAASGEEDRLALWVRLSGESA